MTENRLDLKRTHVHFCVTSNSVSQWEPRLPAGNASWMTENSQEVKNASGPRNPSGLWPLQSNTATALLGQRMLFSATHMPTAQVLLAEQVGVDGGSCKQD